MTIVARSSVGVLVVRERDVKIGNERLSFRRMQEWLAETRKRITRGIERRCFDMTVATDARYGSFTRKELLAVTTETRRMLGKLGDIGKRSVALAHFLPVLRRKLVTGIAREFFFTHVRRVSEGAIGRLGGRIACRRTPARLRTSLRFDAAGRYTSTAVGGRH